MTTQDYKDAAKQRSDIAHLQKQLEEQNKKAFVKISVLEKTIAWLNKRPLWARILNKQPLNNIKEAA